MWDRALTTVSREIQKCSPEFVLRRVWCEIELWLHSCARFADLIFQFFWIFSRSRPETAKTETLLRRPRKPLPAKTQGFTPECLFKPEFTRSPVDMMVKMLTMPTASSNYALAQWVFALNRALAEVSCTFCRANSTTQIQNRTESLSFLGLFLWNRAIATVSCTCCRANPTTQIQRCSLSLYKFLCEIALSLQSRAHFALRIRPQAAPNASFFHDFYVKPSSPYNIVRILPTSSSKSAPRHSIFF